jgi:hypothetical protein
MLLGDISFSLAPYLAEPTVQENSNVLALVLVSPEVFSAVSKKTKLSDRGKRVLEIAEDILNKVHTQVIHTAEQWDVVEKATEFYARISHAQFIGESKYYWRLYRGSHQGGNSVIPAVETLLEALERSIPIFRHAEGEIAWDLYQVIRYRLSWDHIGILNPTESDKAKWPTVNFDEPRNSSELPLPKLERVEQQPSVL